MASISHRITRSLILALILGGTLALLGLGVLWTGRLSLATPVGAGLVALAATAIGVFSVLALRKPISVLSQTEKTLAAGGAALVFSVVLVFLYWQQESMAQALQGRWGLVVSLAPTYEITLGKLLASAIMASTACFLLAAFLHLALLPWKSTFIRRAAASMRRAAVLCAATGLTVFLFSMGRSFALMSLAGN